MFHFSFQSHVLNRLKLRALFATVHDFNRVFHSLWPFFYSKEKKNLTFSKIFLINFSLIGPLLNIRFVLSSSFLSVQNCFPSCSRVGNICNSTGFNETYLIAVCSYLLIKNAFEISMLSPTFSLRNNVHLNFRIIPEKSWQRPVKKQLGFLFFLT